ncbi:MAG: PTS sugar transporter subunit IIA [Deltaproteobacteria bacterium]|nr:PTS sugar transporter subunit IIA [Candidatus Anaeroferrophillus wilburensis]MBN2889461.1 PTS sugar transporter subunit IIA [Deltaproteobacteria bacterium]
MKLSDYFDQSLIISDLDCADKDTVLKKFAACVHQRFPELEAEEIYHILKEREDLGSTGIGEGIAIPHGKMKNLSTIIAAFARSKDGVPFDSIDEQPVKFFFLLLAAENSASLHLKALAKISRMLKNTSFRDQLAMAEGASGIYQVISAEDERL